MAEKLAKSAEPRAELIVAAMAPCGGHAVKELDELALAVVANPHGPKLAKDQKWIGAGISKSTVAICEAHVLKVCYSDNGIVGPQGLNEVRFWRESKSDVRQLLAPIEACDAMGRWILAGRCIPAQSYDGPLPVVSRQAAIDAMRHAGLSDLHGGNIGVYVRDGKPYWVCLDYGADHKGGGRQLVMGAVAGTAMVAAARVSRHCFTGKLRADCTCNRCNGRGLGFHKGMGLKQRQPSLMLDRLCWTGKAVPCGCAKCEGNRKLRRAIRFMADVGLIGHHGPIAARPKVAAKAPRAAAKARKVVKRVDGPAAGFKALAAAVVAADPDVLAPVAGDRASEAIACEHDKAKGPHVRCDCDACQDRNCPDCGAMLFGLKPADCFNAGRKACPHGMNGSPISCDCQTACGRHCCQDRHDDEPDRASD